MQVNPKAIIRDRQNKPALDFFKQSFSLSVLVTLLLAQCGCQNSTALRTEDNVALRMAVKPVARYSLSEMEKRSSKIEEQLETLCPISFRNGYGSEGGRSAVHAQANRREWFEIKLDKPTTIDQVVLIPAIWRDAKYGLRADGFPLDFKIIIGVDGESEGEVVASFTEASGLLPRTAPLVVPCDSIQGSWVRIEATRLSPRIWDSQFTFKLSEIMIFSGHENVALRRVLTASDQSHRPEYLVDGFIPFLMDGKTERGSVAFMKIASSKESDFQPQPEITLDIKSIQPLNQIHLHTLELSNSAPRSLGVPRRLLVEGALKPDFTDAVELLNTELNLGKNINPVVMLNFPETKCRFVRLRALTPDVYNENNHIRHCIGFAEIELLSKGKNAAKGASVQANFSSKDPNRQLSSMTDGMNFYGEILPLRDWVNELALRHDLDGEKSFLAAEINRRYATHSSRLKWVSVLAVFLAVGIGMTVVMSRFARARQLSRLKERFAADLHDELGANIHAIGILSDLAKETVDSPEKLESIHDEIRAMTERSGVAIRNWTNIMDDERMFRDLYEDMKRATERIMADIPGEVTFEGDKNLLESLNPRRRADLILFYKECLVNISRHSQATQFSAKLLVDEQAVSCIVTDNGIGLNKIQNKVPRSLLRRARLLGADIQVCCPEQGGTEVALQLRTKKYWLSNCLATLKKFWPASQSWPHNSREASYKA